MVPLLALYVLGQVRHYGPMTPAIGADALAPLLGDAWRRSRGSSDALAAALRALVVDGRVAVRTRIPSERALAERLGVSRGTVSRAYDRLREEGHLTSARGAGSRLTLPGGGEPLPLPRRIPAGAIDLSVAALPAPEPLLAEALERAARRLSRYSGQAGYAPAGLPELREAVAARFTERGLFTHAEQILVTSGAQHALRLILGLLTAPGDRALVDGPTYPRSLTALRAHRVRAVGVPLAPDGWDVDAWRETIAAASPRLAFTIPDFHNPTALTMAAAARRELAGLCARAGTLLVADETMSELRLDGPPLPAPLEAAITVGTMSKAAWGGLRVGWIRAAPQLVRELTAARMDLDLASPVLEQLLAAELLARWDEVLATRRALLAERRAALVEALAEHAPAWTFPVPHGGLSVWARLPEPVAAQVASAAARERVVVAAGPSFGVDGSFEHHLRIPYTLPPDQLRSAVERLAAVSGRLGAGAGVLEPAAVV